MEVLKFDRETTEIMKFDFEESRHITEHFHQNIEVLYIFEGNVKVTVSKNTYLMQKDDVILIEPNKKHSFDASEQILVGILHISYREFIKYFNLNQYYFRCNSAIDKNKGYQEIRKTLSHIFRLYFDKSQERVYLNSLYFALLHTLIANFAFKSEDLGYADPKSQEEKRINEMIQYMNNNYQYQFSLNELAEYLNLSTTYLSKYIKKNLGQNFVNYMNQIRLEYAIEEMRHSEKSLTRIALDNGFPNTTAFSAAFRNKYNENPSVWQKKYHESNENTKELEGKRDREKGEYIRAFLEQTKPEKLLKEGLSIDTLCVNTQKTFNYKKNWCRLINIGSVTNILRSDLQEHLVILQETLNIEYVRFWDLFTKEMFIDIKEFKGKYNFARIDKALDFLINHKMHPFIELGYKPIILLKTVDKEITEEREIGFHNLPEYNNILYTFMTHCVNRYGLEEVEKWYFEQWGDPRIVSGDSFGKYFEIFETAYHALKAVSPQIHVGGAGFGRLYSTLDFKEIISLWKRRMCNPDFISLYSYPYLARSNNISGNNNRIQDPNFMNNQVLMMREVMEEVSLHTSELIVTEWSSSVSDWNSLNDSVYKAAFILKSIIDNIGCLDMMGYWQASDIIVEHFDSGTILRGGNGLLSVDGIKKPAFHAIRFANGLEKILLGKDSHSMITANGSGNYYIVCHNYINPNFRYYLKREDEVEVRKQFLLFDEAESIQLSYQINNVNNGKYLMKIHSMSSDHGSVQDEWAEMGYSENLNQSDVEYLRNISTPKISIVECSVKNHVLNIEVTLKPHEIKSIHLCYQME